MRLLALGLLLLSLGAFAQTPGGIQTKYLYEIEVFTDTSVQGPVPVRFDMAKRLLADPRLDIELRILSVTPVAVTLPANVPYTDMLAAFDAALVALGIPRPKIGAPSRSACRAYLTARNMLNVPSGAGIGGISRGNASKVSYCAVGVEAKFIGGTPGGSNYIAHELGHSVGAGHTANCIMAGGAGRECWHPTSIVEINAQLQRFPTSTALTRPVTSLTPPKLKIIK